MLPKSEDALVFFTTIGGLAIIIHGYKMFQFCSLYLRTGNIQAYLESDEPWALVTGSTNGIGYSMASQLSFKGFNVILHGRNATKLSELQAELSTAFPQIKYRTFVADASASSDTMVTTIRNFTSSIKDLNLRLLINNVGGTGNMQKDFVPFTQHSTREINDLVSTNLLFTTHLTHALIPSLSEHQPSLILNTGSSGQTGIPYISVYSATKAYLSSWGNAMAIEMQSEGLDIEVLTVLSGNTQSGQDKRPANFMRPTSDKFAKAALEKVGQGRAIVIGYIGHALMSAIMSWMPEWAQRRTLVSFMKPMKGRNLDE